MDIYLYCSYTHARLGFCLTRLDGGVLVPASLPDSTAGRLIDGFFFYDRFRVLWQEYTQESAPVLVPAVSGGVFGMRSLHGRIGDRDGVANFMLGAERDEVERLRSVARGILRDPGAFARKLFACLELGGPCGYQADGASLRGLFDSAGDRESAEPFHPLDRFISPAVENVQIPYARKLLRFAVYTSSWEQVSELFHPRLLWHICPKQAISEKEFLSLYTGRQAF